MHFLSLLFVAAASFTLVSGASVPASSLQDLKQSRKALQRRQARRDDIVRRMRNGPKKRQQQASPLACADPIGQGNLFGNDGFYFSPWQSLPGDGQEDGAIRFASDAGYSTTELYVIGYYASTSPDTGGIFQTPLLCPGATYALSFYSGLYQPLGAAGVGCKLTVTIGDTTVYDARPCSDPAHACELPTFANLKEFRLDTFTYVVPGTGGPVPTQIQFFYDCTVGGVTTLTLLDGASLQRTA